MDAETGLLPREFTYSGIVLGLALSWFAPTDSTATQFFLRVYGAQLPSACATRAARFRHRCLVGAGFFYLAWALYYLLRKRHGMGFGDIALMAMVGGFLGLKLTLLVIFSAPLAGTVYAAFLLLAGRFRKTSEMGEARAGQSSGSKNVSRTGTAVRRIYRRVLTCRRVFRRVNLALVSELLLGLHKFAQCFVKGDRSGALRT